jgi:hypothetical protein
MQCCDIAVRIAAARLRAVDPAWRVEARVRAFARAQVEAMLGVLEDVTPCKAVYGARTSGGAPVGDVGTPVERPGEPVLCLQECRVHSKGHRASRRVRGGGRTLWEKLVSLLPYNPTWEGAFEPAYGPRPDRARAVASLVDDCVALLEEGEGDFLGPSLAALLAEHGTGGMTALHLAPLPGVALPPAAALRACPVPLLADTPAPPATMPYCIGCADKLVVAPAGAAAGGAQMAAAAAAAGGGGAPTASVATPVPSRSWLAGKVMDVLGMSGGGGGGGGGEAVSVSAVAAVPRAARGGSVKEEAAAAAAAGACAQQVCILGLCQACVTALARR